MFERVRPHFKTLLAWTNRLRFFYCPTRWSPQKKRFISAVEAANDVRGIACNEIEANRCLAFRAMVSFSIFLFKDGPVINDNRHRYRVEVR